MFVLTGARNLLGERIDHQRCKGSTCKVIQIGSTTCGKPYGFYPQDNCGTTYFSVEFRGRERKGFGDYPDGFSPADTVSNVGAVVTGCSVGDDFRTRSAIR